MRTCSVSECLGNAKDAGLLFKHIGHAGQTGRTLNDDAELIAFDRFILDPYFLLSQLATSLLFILCDVFGVPKQPTDYILLNSR